MDGSTNMKPASSALNTAAHNVESRTLARTLRADVRWPHGTASLFMGTARGRLRCARHRRQQVASTEASK
jgi:hypothetical protein